MLFKLSGVTKPFKGNGRKLGYPTANIDISADTPEGQFLGTVEFNGNSHNAIIFIGTPVTMGDTVKRAEAHILDFEDKDLYDADMVFCVEYKLRDNKLFDSEELLIEQLKDDEIQARKYFKRTNNV